MIGAAVMVAVLVAVLPALIIGAAGALCALVGWAASGAQEPRTAPPPVG
ncbi:MAG: hypothetical protein ACRD0D_05330 [Acidimicrobiales bacterium]